MKPTLVTALRIAVVALVAVVALSGCSDSVTGPARDADPGVLGNPEGSNPRDRLVIPPRPPIQIGEVK